VRSQADIDLVGDAVNAEAAVRNVLETRPDLSLLDIRMPVMDGITAGKKIDRRDDSARGRGRYWTGLPDGWH
jgi:YesN/AraC family two-component response regulator